MGQYLIIIYVTALLPKPFDRPQVHFTTFPHHEKTDKAYPPQEILRALFPPALRACRSGTDYLRIRMTLSDKEGGPLRSAYCSQLPPQRRLCPQRSESRARSKVRPPQSRSPATAVRFSPEAEESYRVRQLLAAVGVVARLQGSRALITRPPIHVGFRHLFSPQRANKSVA